MINLLPSEEKLNLLGEEQKKIVLILSLVVMIFFAALILVLISVNFSVASQSKSQNILLTNINNEFKKAEIQNIENEIKEANSKFSELDHFYQQKISMSAFLEKISNMLPEGIYLKGMTINPLGQDPSAFQVVLSGHASSIENVIGLRDRLKEDNAFSNIAFSDKVWFEKQNFDFDVTFQAEI